jgi:hypothetical protein
VSSLVDVKFMPKGNHTVSAKFWSGYLGGAWRGRVGQDFRLIEYLSIWGLLGIYGQFLRVQG